MTGSGRRSSILIVEDNPTSRRLVARCLDGYDLRAAGDGEEALAQLETERFDLVLLDIGLPGIDGYEVLRRIRSDPRSAGTMVILVTARGRTPDVVKGFENLADDYVVKPFRQEELVARVRSALRLKSLQDELRRINEGLETEVRERTRQLLAQQRFALLGRNSAQLAHNLKSPLSAVMGYADLALRHPEEDQQDLLTRIRDAAAEMQSIIGRLLLGLRSREAAIAESENLNLNAVVEDQIEFWQVDPKFRYETRVVRDLASGLPIVAAVRTDLVQIITNLIDNALYALRDRSEATITFRTRERDGEVFLEVEDNGVGIAAEDLTRVFEPNFTTKPAGEGTGLGLASCWELATGNGGRLEVTAELQRGTTISLVLPAARFAAGA